jgi:hypothetical protein
MIGTHSSHSCCAAATRSVIKSSERCLKPPSWVWTNERLCAETEIRTRLASQQTRRPSHRCIAVSSWGQAKSAGNQSKAARSNERRNEPRDEPNELDHSACKSGARAYDWRVFICRRAALPMLQHRISAQHAQRRQTSFNPAVTDASRDGTNSLPARFQ